MVDCLILIVVQTLDFTGFVRGRFSNKITILWEGKMIKLLPQKTINGFAP